MNMIAAFAACCTLVPALAFGQKQSRARGTGSIEGDAYLVMQSGDTKRGAGQTVALFRDADGQLTQRVGSACALEAQAPASIALIARVDSLLQHISPGPGSGAMLDSLVHMRLVLANEVASMVDASHDSLAAALRRSPVFGSAGTGMSAHYAFASVPSGRYVVAGDFDIADHHYRWWAPVTVAPGAHVKRDLDNAAADAYAAMCPEVHLPGPMP